MDRPDRRCLSPYSTDALVGNKEQSLVSHREGSEYSLCIFVGITDVGCGRSPVCLPAEEPKLQPLRGFFTVCAACQGKARGGLEIEAALQPSLLQLNVSVSMG